MKYRKSHRLLSAEDFRYVFEKPKKIRGKAMDFYIRSNKGHSATTITQPTARLGIAVPKRCIKLAVMRNSIKRHLREKFRLNTGTLEGFDLVVLINSGMTTIPCEEYGKVIDAHWDRLIEQCKAQ